MGKKTETQAEDVKTAAPIQSQLLPLSQIEPNKGQIEGLPKNPRLIRDDKYRKLKASIQENPEMLALRELLVFRHGKKYVIIGGNMRFQALKELGYEETLCKVIPEGTTVQQLKAYTIKDNSGFGEWDMDQLANLWDAEELDRWGVDIPISDDDTDAEEDAKDDDYDVSGNLPTKAKSKEGDIYKLGRHRLVCGDSTEAETLDVLMGKDKADLFLTDPPYNVDYSSKNEALNAADKGNRVQKDIANDKMDGATFLAFLKDAFGNANRYLKEGGAFYIWHAGTEGLNFKTAVQDTGWLLKQVLIWVKNNMVLGRQDYQWKHEPCLYGWKPGASHFFINRRDLLTVLEDESLDIDSMNKAELRDLLKSLLDEDKTPTTVLHEDKPLRSAEHPTMKPLKLMGRLIRYSSRPGDVVLDTFAGSGSTLMAAEQLGRACYCIELDPCYVDVIIKRWQEYTGDKAEYLGNFKNSEQ
jgi:site-specific DNA-methyltransferase (adenine-specific)